MRDTGSNQAYDYTLTAVVVDAAVDADNTTLVSGETLTAGIVPGDIDTYTIDVAAGDDLLLSFSELGPNSIGVEVDIVDPDGTVVSSVSNTASANLEALGVAVGGTYTVIVRDTGSNQAYDYTLTAVTN